jgi:hypothetical protein
MARPGSPIQNECKSRQSSPIAAILYRVPVTGDDPAIGLPVGDEWIAEVDRKLKAGWFKRGAVEAVPMSVEEFHL